MPVFGCVNYQGRSLPKKIVVNMIDSLKPDWKVVDCFQAHSFLIGKVEIKEILNKGNKIHNEAGLPSIISGEIYNEKEVARKFKNFEWCPRSIFHLYQKNGMDFVKYLNGSFTIAIYDKYNEKSIIANDRYGLQKLFYYDKGDYFIFAPKIKPLLKFGPKKSLRKDAIIDFFLFGYLLGDKTFFEHIYQLPPASILEVSKEGIKLTKYWDYKYDEEYDARPKEEMVEKLGRLWQKAVERRIKKDEKIIIPLSGGLDSRAILATALKCTPKDNIITFTFGEKGSFDFEIGKMVAKISGVKNIPLGVEKDDFEGQYNISMDDIEGMIDATPYFAIRGYKEMKKFGEIFFTGTMIDVLLGRHILSSIFSSDMLKKEISSDEDYVKVKGFIFNHQKLNDEKEILKLFNPAFLRDLDIKSSYNRTHQKFKNIKNKKFPDYFAVWDYTNRWNKYIYFAVLRNRNLFKYHTMLDSDLVDFTLKIPLELRLDENLYIQMLLKKYPELFKLPAKTNLGLGLNAGNTSLFLRRVILFLKGRINKISSILIKRNVFLDKGKNYIDYDNLLRRNKEYRNYMRSMIEKVKEREYFNKGYIEEIWRLHMQGKKNYSMLFGLLVTFELFLERFCDE